MVAKQCNTGNVSLNKTELFPRSVREYGVSRDWCKDKQTKCSHKALLYQAEAYSGMQRSIMKLYCSHLEPQVTFNALFYSGRSTFDGF